ncbi:glutathione S-transferase T1-like isoform X2 [Vicia villosa]|uniref:glutathione S-transferase T1-like isoform X2 n=1 Tax=Vicia villosa TaxID=3911 RepID=UPI00273BCD84|nr:glutathione S-transferase T1-like isoform X2 [Vicia villosa]
MEKKLKVYADRMSQPSRAVLIFCRLNGIDFEEIKIDTSKRHQLSPEYTVGHPLNPKAASEAEKILLSSLSILEKIWLNGDGRFLLGGFQPSIADLSLVCELIQLEVLDEKDRNRILSPYKKVVQWIEDTRAATNPHFEQVHNILYRVKKKLQQQRSRDAEAGTETRNKMGRHSKM